MALLRVIVTALCGAALFSPALAFNPTFNYGGQKVRGVNLGGWLVLEPWITPSLFDSTGNAAIVDEYTFGQLQDKATASAALKQHWDTWITESDFQAIAAAGLNHVRLPIGYWAYEVSAGEPYIQGQLPYLEKALTWASNTGLKVIIDLHGAPGSQNSFDNSGQRMSSPKWHTQQSYIDRTNAIIKRIAASYRNRADVVAIIAPLNEPAGFYGEDILRVTRQYWYDSYGNVRYPYGDSTQSNNLLLIHDAFQDLSYWNGAFNNLDGIAIDKHIYQMFSQAENQRTEQQHIDNACSNAGTLSSFYLWVIVGEWTPAATDCAKYLNGRGVGSRYDGTYPGSTRIGSCTGRTGRSSTFSASYKEFLRKYWEAQAITYEKGAGWIQWTWKAEIADEWTYQAGLAGGWIPQQPTERKYPNICG